MVVKIESEPSDVAAVLELDVQWNCAVTSKLPRETDLLRWASAVLPDEVITREVTIRVVDKREMQAANNEWRQKNRPTNVLSFPADFPPETGIDYLGDIMICAEVLLEESVQQKKSLDAHWAHIVIHGMLHLLGFDHLDEQGAVEMESIEVEILRSFGYNNPYESPRLESGKS